jgi:hypothetical protein
VNRQLTERERALLNALLSVDFTAGVEGLRREAEQATVVGGCGCGCPSIDFYKQPRLGMQVRVNAATEGNFGGLFLYTLGGRLGGIEWVGTSDEVDPPGVPDPATLTIHPAESALPSPRDGTQALLVRPRRRPFSRGVRRQCLRRSGQATCCDGLSSRRYRYRRFRTSSATCRCLTWTKGMSYRT